MPELIACFINSLLSSFKSSFFILTEIVATCSVFGNPELITNASILTSVRGSLYCEICYGIVKLESCFLLLI